MRISDNAKPVTGCFELYTSMDNKKHTNEEMPKIEIGFHADINNCKEDKKRNLVIEKLKFSDLKAEYSVHKATNRIVFKLYNKKDGRLLKEIPAVKMLDLAADIMERAEFLLDERV